VKDIEEQVDALAERIEIADITNKVLRERIDELFAKLESLQKMVDE
jgi:peptidoglycan hydrolase CwlO-like protein